MAENSRILKPEALSILSAVAARYQLRLHDAELSAGGFSGARVFQATTVSGQRFAIRQMPHELSLPAARIRALHRLLTAVYDAGVVEISVPLIPTAVPDDRGLESTILATTATNSADRWISLGEDRWQVEPWMPGTPATGKDMEGPRVRSAVERMHAFHVAAAHYVAKGHGSEWFYLATEPSPAILRRSRIAWDLRNGQLQQLLQQTASDSDDRFRTAAAGACRVLEQWLPWLVRELAQATAQKVAVQPVLRDIWRAHVLFRDKRVSGLIDLSAAASDNPAVDAARLFRSWFGGDRLSIIAAFREFAALRPFTSVEQHLFTALDASSVLLSPVTWIRRRADGREQGLWSHEALTRFEELVTIARQFEPVTVR